jgi:hypothetical protein
MKSKVVSMQCRCTGGVELQVHTFLNSALDGGEWSASRWQLYPHGKSPWYPLDRRLEHCMVCPFLSRSEDMKYMVIKRIVLLDFIHPLVSHKIEELKIYTKYHNTHVHKIHTRVNY